MPRYMARSSGLFVGLDGIMKSIPNPRHNTWQSHGNAIRLYWKHRRYAYSTGY